MMGNLLPPQRRRHGSVVDMDYYETMRYPMFFACCAIFSDEERREYEIPDDNAYLPGEMTAKYPSCSHEFSRIKGNIFGANGLYQHGHQLLDWSVISSYVGELSSHST